MERLKLKLDHEDIKYTDKDLRNYIENKWKLILPLSRYEKLYMLCSIVNWIPTQKKWERLVARQGGGISCIDWSFKLFKWVRSMINKLSAARTKAKLQSIEEMSTDPTYSKLLVCIFNVTNKYLFCSYAHLIPDACEKHCYIVPTLAKVIMMEILYCEIHKTISSYCIKSDGLTNNQDLHNKIFTFMIKYFGKYVLKDNKKGNDHIYDFLEDHIIDKKSSTVIQHFIYYVQNFDKQHEKRMVFHQPEEKRDIKCDICGLSLSSHVIVDPMHRGICLHQNHCLAVGHGDESLCIHDRYALNHKQCSVKRAIIIDKGQYDFYTFWKTYKHIYLNHSKLLNYIILYCQACLKMRRSPIELAGDLRQYTFVDTAEQNQYRTKNNMYDLVTDLIKFALSRLPVQHYGHILMIFCGWATVQEMMDNRIVDGNRVFYFEHHANGNDQLKISKCDIPKKTVPFNVIKQICRMVQMRVPTKKEWSQCGFHNFTHWREELRSFY